MFSLCSCGNTPASHSVYQPHGQRLDGTRCSITYSFCAAFTDCLLCVEKSLISLRMAVQLNGDPSLHQELHRERVCFSCPGCGGKQGCGNIQRWSSKAGLHCEIHSTNVKMDKVRMGNKG